MLYVEEEGRGEEGGRGGEEREKGRRGGGEGEGKKGGRRGRRGKKNFVLSALTHPLALSVKPIKLLSCA